jgi:predicted transcriptional regulator of viral defense system
MSKSTDTESNFPNIPPQLLRATKGEKTDVRGYVSLLSALNLHGMIDQAPHVIQIVAERICPTVRTPFGTYQFHRLAVSG